MSLFVSMHVDCPQCEHTNTMNAVGSVNADRRPDLRDDIVADTFQIITCADCGAAFRLQPEFNYLDVENGLWIMALPADSVLDYLENEDRATNLFRAFYGEDAPPAARDVGSTLNCRVTFGWQAVREKILLAVSGLDDVVVELMKMDMLRRMPEVHLDAGVELRVTAVGEENLELAWVKTDTEEALQFIAVERIAYTSIAEAQEKWSAVQTLLCDGPFVDMQKMFLGQGRNASAAQ